MILLLVACLLAVFYTQVGYACAMWLLARWFPRGHDTTLPLPDAITVVLCVHNGAKEIEQRLRNLAACHWEGGREILVFCDGCEDDTAARADGAGIAGVRVLASTEQRGKWAALNDAIKSASHPIVVFADLRQTYDPDALKKLAEAFRDPAVGAVSGLLEIAASGSGGGRGVDLYWRIERKLREWEARFDSVIGCTGAIYAIRRELFTELTPGTILDDVVIPMQIALQGRRIAYEPRAVAFDPQDLDPVREKGRKLRTLVGNFQMLEQHPRWLLPWRNRLWWQLLSHKVARLTVPWLLGTIAILTVATTKSPFIWSLLGLQALCYTLGILGWVCPGLRTRWVTVPAGFLLLQWSCALALPAYLRVRRDPLKLWTRATGGQSPTVESRP
jgi:cellulose synthase/poly-beta-1,6-N-acetylglucosamine synthase-like glycosyltransferase